MKNLAVFAVCVLVRLAASFFFVERRRNRFHTISACPITITQLKSTARSVPRRLTNSYTTGTIHTDHRTTQHYPITPITTTIMSEEEKTAPVVTEEPKVEEAAPAGEDAPAKEEESTATFEPVVRQVKFQLVIARRLEFPCRLYAGCRSGTAIHRSIAIYHLIPSHSIPFLSLSLSLFLAFLWIRSN
jgi:hypothetical protein